jgi:hypothetical protein
MDRFSVTQAIQPKPNDGRSPACFNRRPGQVEHDERPSVSMNISLLLRP